MSWCVARRRSGCRRGRPCIAGLVVARARRRKRSGYVRWQRTAAMQLWQLDQAPLPATRSVLGRLMTSDDTGTACQSDAGR